LDQDAIRQNRSRFHIGVTNINTAQPEYIEVNHSKNQDMIKFIQASSAVPGLAKPRSINGTLYGDGIIACKNPVGYAIESFGATDIVCVVNQPLREPSSRLGDRALSALLTLGYSKAIRSAYRDRHESSDESANTVYDESVRIGVFCPQGKPIGRLSRNTERLIQIAQQAEQQVSSVLG